MRHNTLAAARGLSTWRAGLMMGMLAAGLLAFASAQATPIRISANNVVPACVTPERLMAFLRERNPDLDLRYRDIAAWYKTHGEALRVRWDYAFFQMLVETNYLTFRRGNGKRGDVHPRQNNFAGIGATGGGVPGESFPDVSTGVRAQLEHLVVYSGEYVPSPVAQRTRTVQEHILSWTAPLSRKRPVTFQDLAGKWAADRSYWRSISLTAKRFYDAYCRNDLIATSSGPRPSGNASSWSANVASASMATVVAPNPARAVRPQPQPPRPEPTACRVFSASYGGKKAVLIRHVAEDAIEYTALEVLDGFEASMAESYMKTYAPQGRLIGEFPSSEQAFARAYELCPGAGG